MAQIQRKFIADSAINAAKLASDAVEESKILNGAVTNSKVASGIDAVKLADGTVTNTEFQTLNGVTSGIQAQLDAKVDESREGVANGIATLDSGGKVPASQLPNSVMDYLGTWAASTNTPTLANGTGSAGDVYVASDAGTVNFGAGAITFDAGDWVIYSGTVWQKSVNSNSVASVNGFTGAVSLDTDDIPEGTALYFTDERAQDAVGTALTDTASVDLVYNDVGNTIEANVNPGGVNHNDLLNYDSNQHVDHSSVQISTSSTSGLSGGGDLTATRSIVVAPDQATSGTIAGADEILFADVSASNVLRKTTAQDIANLAAPATTNEKQNFTLVSGDITNQYVDLSSVARTDSIIVSVSGVLQYEGSDYTVNYTGGSGGNTRITFAGDLATAGAAALVAGDVLRVQYEF